MNKQELLIGICGSVGAISIVNYLYTLKDSYNINLILTKNALNFVQPKGLDTFIENYYIKEFKRNRTLHIELATLADKLLILPASANVISKMAHGIADDLLTSTLLAYESKVYIAANMNPKMWNNPIIQDNVSYLKSKGHIFVNEGRKALESCTGEVVYSEACMPDVNNLISALKDM